MIASRGTPFRLDRRRRGAYRTRDLASAPQSPHSRNADEAISNPGVLSTPFGASRDLSREPGHCQMGESSAPDPWQRNTTVTTLVNEAGLPIASTKDGLLGRSSVSVVCVGRTIGLCQKGHDWESGSGSACDSRREPRQTARDAVEAAAATGPPQERCAAAASGHSGAHSEPTACTTAPGLEPATASAEAKQVPPAEPKRRARACVSGCRGEQASATSVEP
jgi:hypothetical protein